MFEMQQLANVPYIIMGHSKLDSKSVQSTANGISRKETISMLELDHKPASQDNFALSLALSDANLTRYETFDRGRYRHYSPLYYYNSSFWRQLFKAPE